MAIGLDIVNVSLCLAEALQNAVVHGNMGIRSDGGVYDLDLPGYWEQIIAAEQRDEIRRKPVYLTVGFNGGYLALTVQDQGAGFDYSRLQFDEEEKLMSYGRGIVIMRELSQNIEYLGNGNCVRLLF